MKTWNVALICVLSMFAASCGKDISIGDLSGIGNNNPNSSDTSLQCTANDIVRWQFIQPLPTVNRSVDLLFVVDTSASLNTERARVAATLPAFVQALDQGIDYRIGVMLAHGGASSWSGRLYSSTVNNRVLNSSTQSSAQIQSELSARLATVPSDQDEGGGEMMMYSLIRSLKTDRLTELRNQGFYRNDAGLSVVFVSDENDVCFRPDLNGYTTFPHFVPSYLNSEITAFNRYCSGIDPSTTLAKLRSVKNERPVMLAAVAHIDPARVVRESEDSIGHGMIELVQSTLDSELINITDSSYASGLARLGNVTSTSLNLKTVFHLTNATGIVSRTLQVTVDGKAVTNKYDSPTANVQIQAGDAGRAGSLIEVSACKQAQ